MLKARMSAAALACVMGATLLAGAATAEAATAEAAAPAKYTHAQAYKLLREAGIEISSSGGCYDPKRSNCTGLEGLNRNTVHGIIAFKRISKCPIRITGGTEVGHKKGKYSHENGYKVDISRKPEFEKCVTPYIKKNFRYFKKRSDGAAVYRSHNGNHYALEGNHWDITYFNHSA